MKKLSKKTLNKAFRNWYYGHLTCFSQEHMQTFGYLCAMLPVIEELYDTKDEQKEALETYKAFFNTEPQLARSSWALRSVWRKPAPITKGWMAIRSTACAPD